MKRVVSTKYLKVGQPLLLRDVGSEYLGKYARKKLKGKRRPYFVPVENTLRDFAGWPIGNCHNYYTLTEAEFVLRKFETL